MYYGIHFVTDGTTVLSTENSILEENRNVLLSIMLTLDVSELGVIVTIAHECIRRSICCWGIDVTYH
jgi:hypothetical protein